MMWCLPCATMKPPMHSEATGENEEGDPACHRHQSIPGVGKCTVAQMGTPTSPNPVLEQVKEKPMDARTKRKYVRKAQKEPETLRQDDFTATPFMQPDPVDPPTRLETTNLVVTERMLDNFWGRMTIAQKTRAVQDVLESYI